MTTVQIHIIDNLGYGPEQVKTSVTLGGILEAIEDAIAEFGEDARVVLNNGQRYGATFGAFETEGYLREPKITEADEEDF